MLDEVELSKEKTGFERDIAIAEGAEMGEGEDAAVLAVEGIVGG